MLDDADFERLGVLINAAVKQQIREEVRAIVQEEVRAIVQEEVRAIVKEEVRAIVKQEVRAIVDERMGALEKRLTPRITALENEMAQIKQSVTTLEQRTDNLVKQLAELRGVTDQIHTRVRDLYGQMKMNNEALKNAFIGNNEQDDRLDNLETLVRRFMTQQPPSASPGS